MRRCSDLLYANCDKEDWWQTVCGIIENVTGQELAPQADAAAAPAVRPINVYIENIVNDSIGGFTMPLPATKEEFKPFFDGAEITGWRDMAITQTFSDIKTLFQVMDCILQNAPTDNAIFKFLDRKRAEGKHYYCYMCAGSAKFLRTYYARIKEFLDSLYSQK